MGIVIKHSIYFTNIYYRTKCRWEPIYII